MANGYRKPRIVVEESPWGNFLADLPGNILSFMQLQNQLQYNREEKEKDREFQMSKLYLTDTINTKNQRQKGLIEAINDANASGITIETKLSDLSKRSPEHFTSSSGNVANDYKGYLSEYTNYMTGLFDEVSEKQQLFNEGRRSALAIDTNYNGIIDPDELDVFQESYGKMPEPFMQGAKNHLTNPTVRAAQDKKRKQYNTGKELAALNNLFPEDPNLLAANSVFRSNPNSAKVQEHIAKVFTERENPADAIKDQLETIDITFRNYMEGLESSRTGVHKKFLRGLKIQGTEDYKAKSLTDPNFVTSFRRDLGENFATWFSGETREGSGYGSDKPVAWIRKKFKAEGGWDDIDNSVPKVIGDPRFEEMLLDRDKLKHAFDWKGTDEEEEAANNFFLKAVEIYDTIDKIEGRAMGYSQDFLDKLGSKTTTPTNQTQVPADSTAVPAGKKETLSKEDISRIGQGRIIQEPVEQQDFFYSEIPTLTSDRDPLRIQQDMNTLNYIYDNPNTPAEVRGEVGSALDLLIRESQETHALESLIDVATDHRSGTSLIDSALNALSNFEDQEQVSEIVRAVTSSDVIKNDFRKAQQDINLSEIISAWQASGLDAGSFLMDEWENIEPEFIR